MKGRPQKQPQKQLTGMGARLGDQPGTEHFLSCLGIPQKPISVFLSMFAFIGFPVHNGFL